MLSLDRLFNTISNRNYVIIEIPVSFPLYKPGLELVLFCEDINLIARNILSFGNCDIDDRFYIKLSNNEEKNNIKIEFIFNQNTDLCFKLYQGIPYNSVVKMSPFYFNSILDCRVSKSCNPDRPLLYYSPSKVDILILNWLKRVNIDRYANVESEVRNHFFNVCDSTADAMAVLARIQKYSIGTTNDISINQHRFRMIRKQLNSVTFFFDRIRSIPPKRIPQKIISKMLHHR